MDYRYMTLQATIPIHIEVVVKLDDDGMVVDVYTEDVPGRRSNCGNSIASTWKLYSEMGVEVRQVEEEE